VLHPSSVRRVLERKLGFVSGRDGGARSKIGKIGISARRPNMETLALSGLPLLCCAASASAAHGPVSRADNTLTQRVCQPRCTVRATTPEEGPLEGRSVYNSFPRLYSRLYSKKPPKSLDTLTECHRYHRVKGVSRKNPTLWPKHLARCHSRETMLHDLIRQCKY
jgi:hypothetical protein